MRPLLRYVWAILALSAVACAGEPELRETPLAPNEELATFELADERLTVELVASEPELDSPVAICWDADARMFVAEMIDYPTNPPGGQVRLLEDRDNDGRYEQATVFASGLSFPNGVLAAAGGVFVTAAPDILFLKDTDGDGEADEKRVVLTGFGEGNQQLRANGLTWGLDNWIYGANGRSDGRIRRPDDPNEKAVSIRGRDFRFTPDGNKFEATSGQSQFGQAADDWGNRFVSWNTIPIRHVLFDREFFDRNPRLAVFAVRDIADVSDKGQVFPISPRPKTFNREPTDYFNALCGLTIYRGDAMGRDYEGSVFVGESLTNLVHRRALEPEGATFVSRRGEHDREFLAAKDSWFHPVYLTTGPDGALYIVDFYRRWVEHPAFVAESLREGIDWRQGAGHGRIWKVSRRENTWPPGPRPQMSRQPTAELVKHLESTNGWRRDSAQRVLFERRDPNAAALLRALIVGSRLPQAKVHALALLEDMGQLDDGFLLRSMEDGDAHVRQFAMRLAAPRLAAGPALHEALVGMADFPSPLVRVQLARSLGKVEGPDKITALVKLADLEARDPVIPLAIVGSLGESAGGFLAQLLDKHPEWRKKPSDVQLRLLRNAAIAAAGCDGGQIAECLKLIAPASPEAAGPGDLVILAGVVQGLSDRGHSLRDMLQSPPEGLRPHVPAVTKLIAAARRMAAAEDESLEHRLAAVEVLGLVDAGSGKILLDLLSPRHVQPLQSAAAWALSRADAATAAEMFGMWNALTIATRRALVAASLRSPATTAALLGAIEQEQILSRELDPATRDALLAVRDPALAPRIKAAIKSDAARRNREEVVAQYTAALERPGDRGRGAATFEKHCLACHMVQTHGQRVGPDLSGIGSRPKETLLVDLFDASRQVTGEYVAYTLLTDEGQLMTGVLVSETADSVTLRRAEGAQDFVLRSRITELRSTGKSLMPDGFEETLSEADVADLLAFLAQPDARLLSKPK
ncbi:MAG: PVC-type heme-binding CxxCH protein [Pirellulales bacterium]